MNTFVMPWFPEGYSLIQANATNSNVGVQFAGQVKAHTHTIEHRGDAVIGSFPYISGTDQNYGPYYTNTGSTGGAANYAAGNNVMLIVKI